MNQSKIPLFDALLQHKSKKTISYHVPGHKGGLVFTEKGHHEYQSILSFDVTELNGLDDLHAPEGAIFEAQKLLAELYKVRESYFLVNGSTVGNLAMILAACREGDTILVQRNCHKSILHGLMLANVKPVFLSPVLDREWGVAGGIESSLIAEALSKYPDTKAIILTYPNYYGLGNDISVIIEKAHEKGIPVLVDEAHGAHFILGSPFLNSSLASGADMVVQSAHKTLPAMTMGSYLHVNSDLIDSDKIRFYLQMLQSSSPSYPIMASLDLARSYLASFTDKDKKALGEKIKGFRQQLDHLPDIKVLQVAQSGDPLKITIRSREGATGFQLQKALEKKDVFTELADTRNVLLVLPLLKAEMEYPFSETIQKISEATAELEPSPFSPDEVADIYEKESAMAELQLSYKDMVDKPKQLVALKNSSGRIAAEMIIPYPPGVPLIMAGELMDENKLTQLEELSAKGTRFHGGSGLRAGSVWVFE
ncbi:aminotransferase class I/II-fold pyridoxal phosphate-dependent enzyme [Bacillus sp. V59.32b]|uniref:aminotransferase class I/II-fold pyridoxal phosphate-dependent enzyme n=1 Tax=Bacillus sp. V59.32b TaxID=1758642 RepID=UPI000E3D2E41|nr:aminotransferase class I/II-fold pyridoxal phosphate-dependent enzyme [Bacillus sp. V59.32b]RFU60966.1 aminotransferase class I/II-fold pyridoxal phosphate-dependent enzyme [Bacillus sp. V59.32b]